MKATKKPIRKTESEVLDHATEKLLAALKKDMIEKDGGIDHDKLLKDGCSPRLLSRLEESYGNIKQGCGFSRQSECIGVS
jgi:hypothetical protein